MTQSTQFRWPGSEKSGKENETRDKENVPLTEGLVCGQRTGRFSGNATTPLHDPATALASLSNAVTQSTTSQ